MNKIKQFFKFFKPKPHIKYILPGVLLLLTVVSVCQYQWLQALLCLILIFVYVRNSVLHEQNTRALEVMDIQEQMIKAMTEELDLAAERLATKSALQPVVGPAYESIADTFSREELKQHLKARGVHSPTRKVIYRWKKAGLIKETAKDIYVKTNIHTSE